MRRHVDHILREEFNGLHPLLQIAIWLSGALPDLVGNRARTNAFRIAGVRIDRGTVIGGRFSIAGGRRAHRRVAIGRGGWINADCYLDASDRIEIGDGVAFGQQVMLLTQTHDIGPPARRAAGLRTAPVRIGHGCWLGARVTVLPGVTVADGSIVAAGSVVTRDVPPCVLAAGVPARVVRAL